MRAAISTRLASCSTKCSRAVCRFKAPDSTNGHRPIRFLPREIDPAISPQLQEVIYRALEREPQNRYATAHEFARDLTHLDQVGVADRPELRDWKKRRGPDARKIALYALLALIPIVIFGLLLYSWRGAEGDDPSREAGDGCTNETICCSGFYEFARGRVLP